MKFKIAFLILTYLSIPIPLEAKDLNTKDVVTVELVTVPDGAKLYVDGAFKGISPILLDLNKGQTYTIRTEKDGYLTVEEKVSIVRSERYVCQLARNKETTPNRRYRTELISISPSVNFTRDGSVGYGVSVNAVGVKWKYFSITLLELGLGKISEEPDTGIKGNYFDIGIRPEFPIYLGVRGQHQIRLCLGLEYAISDLFNHYGYDHSQFIFSPSIHYFFQTEGRFFVSIGLRTLLPLIKSDETNSDYHNEYPFNLLLTTSIGFSSLNDKL